MLKTPPDPNPLDVRTIRRAAADYTTRYKWTRIQRGARFSFGGCMQRLSWQEARAICKGHSDKLVGAHFVGLDCPYCVYFTFGLYQYRETLVAQFLAECWRRQRQGLRPFSRRYWQHRVPFFSSRARYDCLLSVLSEVGIILDRRGKTSGRMMVAPKTSMHLLKLWFAPSGVSGASGQTGSTQAHVPAGGQL